MLAELSGGGPVGGLLDERRRHKGAKGRRGVRRGRELGRRRVGDVHHDLEDGALLCVRRLLLGELDGRDAERPHVDAAVILGLFAVGILAGERLGRHPMRGADHCAAARHRALQLRRDAEISELDNGVAHHEHIGGLDIAMDGPRDGVHVVQPCQHARAHPPDSGLGQRRGALAHHVERRTELGHLHDDPQGGRAVHRAVERVAVRYDIRVHAPLHEVDLVLDVRRCLLVEGEHLDGDHLLLLRRLRARIMSCRRPLASEDGAIGSLSNELEERGRLAVVGRALAEACDDRGRLRDRSPSRVQRALTFMQKPLPVEVAAQCRRWRSLRRGRLLHNSPGRRTER